MPILSLRRAVGWNNGLMSKDPVDTNPEFYRVIYENDRVRVLLYRDRPGDRTRPHSHPDSVMYTMSSFRRRLETGEMRREVAMSAGAATWLPAQEHAGENIGDTETHVLFVELKDEGRSAAARELGPEVD